MLPDVTTLHAENINDKPQTFDFGHGFDGGLPAMSGRGKSDRDKQIIRACLASLERAMNWLNRTRTDLITTYQVDEA